MQLDRHWPPGVLDPVRLAAAHHALAGTANTCVSKQKESRLTTKLDSLTSAASATCLQHFGLQPLLNSALAASAGEPDDQLQQRQLP